VFIFENRFNGFFFIVKTDSKNVVLRKRASKFRFRKKDSSRTPGMTMHEQILEIISPKVIGIRL